MGIGDLFGFLIGRREAIARIAATKRALWLGALFVASAALAREYDAEFLPHNPLVLAIPFAASSAAAFLLFLLLRVACSAPREPFWQQFAKFLALFWMTAPLAWFYGIPYERFLGELQAAEANLWTLGFVAVWRVALVVRVAQVLLGLSLRRALVRVLFFCDLAVLAVVFFAPWPVIEIMGGVRSDVDNMLTGVRFMLGFFSAIGFVALGSFLLAEILFLRGETSHPLAAGPSRRPSLAVWGLAALAIVAWASTLPFTQPPLRESKSKRMSLLASEQFSGERALSGGLHRPGSSRPSVPVARANPWRA